MNSRIEPPFEWIIFDLDDTLYPRAAGVMDAIIERILLFMHQKVNIPLDDVATQRHYFYQKYGTALRGLMEEYHIDPQDYLDFVHDINLADFLGPSPPLDRMLEAIPLRKVIFTNADKAHAERVMSILRVRHHFELVVDIQQLNYINKPDPLAYRRLLELLPGSGRQCILVEDSARNLIPAKDLGMTTILVDAESKSSAIDYVAPTIFHVEQVLENILPMER